MIRNKKIVLLYCLFFLTLVLKAQQIEITVLSHSDLEPVPFAHICSESIASGEKRYQVTNIDGTTTIPLNGKTILTISYVGYRTIIDTVSARDKTTVYKLKQSGFDINEVVVTGQHKPVCADKSIYRIKLIDESEIQKRAAGNIADLLSNELNINISHDPSIGAGLKLQGISGQNVKILIDGVPVIGRLDGNIDLTQLNLSNVDHVEIVEGPMSVIYGSNALAGVINIITKDNRYAKFKAGMKTKYESVGIYNANANMAFRNNKNSFMLHGGRNFFSGFDMDESTRSTEFKPKEQYNAGISYSFLSDKFEMEVKNDFFRERLLNRSDVMRTQFRLMGYDTWFYTIRANTTLQIDHQLTPHLSYNFLGAYSYYNRTRKRYEKDMTNLDTQLSSLAADHDTSTFDAVVARGIFNWHTTNEKFSVQAGFDVNHEHGTGKRMKNRSENIGDYAVFTGIIWNATPAFSVQPGLRAAYNTKYKAPLVPSVNIKYDFRKLNFRASYARGFRAPSLKELYLYFYDSNHQIDGNEDLQAEYSHNVNFSTGYKMVLNKNRIRFTLKAFYNNIDNMIALVRVDPDNDLHYSNQNIGHFESAGGELHVAYQYYPHFNIEAGYLRLGRMDFYKKNDFLFNNNFTSSVNFNFWKNTASLSGYYKFFGKNMFYSNFNELQLNYLDAYHNLDISLSKDFVNKMFELSGGVKNLFNNTIIDGTMETGSAHGTALAVSPIAGWGRTYFISLKINYSKY